MHARIENNAVAEYPIVNLRYRLPDVSLPADLTDTAKLPAGFVYVTTGAMPQYDPATQRIQQKQTPELVDGQWSICYETVALTQDELDAVAAAARENAKAARQVKVEAIKVTTAAGHTFDGDEVSQGRMARAIIALSTGLAPSTTWVLADNTAVQVTSTELIEALTLAGQAQTALWVV